MRRLSLKHWFGIVVVLLLITWLGVRKLNADGVWFDEWWSWYVAGADFLGVPRGVGDIWTRIVEEDIRQGVFYPLALASWGSLVGWTEFADRALSLFAGLIAVAAVYRLGRMIGKRPLTGWAAAAFLGTSVWFIFFLHEMRVYMLMVMFCALFLLLYWRIMFGSREPATLTYISYGVITGLLLNTHYFASVFVGIWGLGHLLRALHARPARRWWGVLGAWLLAGILLVPWLINFPQTANTVINEPVAQDGPGLLLSIGGDVFTAFSNGQVGVFLLLAVFGLRVRSAAWMLIIVLVVLLLNLLILYVFSLNELRYNMMLIPPLALIAALGADQLARRGIPVALIAGVWLFGYFISEGNFDMERRIQRWPAQPIREMAVVLDGHVAPQDVIINLLGNDNRPTLALHPLVHYMGQFGARIEVVENSTFPGTQTFARRMQAAVGDAERIWMVFDPRWRSDEWTLSEYLLNEEGLYHCATLADDPNMRIWGYGRIGAEDQLRWQFGENLVVWRVGVPSIASDVLTVWLGFHVGESVPAGVYSVTMHLLDAEGTLRAQADLALPNIGYSCQRFEIPLAGLPAGNYSLWNAVYAWQNGERLVSTAEDGATTDYIMVGEIAVE